MDDPQREVTISAVIARILVREGGVTQNPTENFTTYFGQTPEWLAANRLPIPHSKDEAAMNYHAWIESHNLDELCDANDALPDVVIDYAVHSGEETAIRSLQRALGVKDDGVIGPKTIFAIKACARRQVAQFVLASRIAQLGRIITAQPDKAIFASNWFRRTSDQVKTLA